MIKGFLTAAAAAGAIAIICAPSAMATTNAEADYLKDLAGALITGDQAGLIADGWTTCKAIASGAGMSDISQQYYDANKGAISHAQADAAVNFAKADLCPAG
ncbi:hypothetical protein ACTXG7_12120 [Mycolicibacterium sp. Dal123E01]|uniref:hypothetical protein n=1 Tax=Mycolicibacterium sp. Dal123E01 TaxID=3457578 RepID=UPI00403EC701